MNVTWNKLLLADDDMDDCAFFKDVLDDLSVKAKLTVVNDGEQLMYTLNSGAMALPDLLFLDINMPRKNGFECLDIIKSDNTLKDLPVIIYTTSLNMDMVDLLYQKGAYHYIRKPGTYTGLIKVIRKALAINVEHVNQPPRDQFIINA